MHRTTRRWWLGAAAMTLAVPAAWAAVRVADVVTPAASESFHGIRLGMTPADVRSRFDVRAGSLRASAGEDGSYALELERPAGTVHSARFEFHEGLLVALRAELDPRDAWADGDGLSITDTTVRNTSAGANGSVALTLLSRSCPTHADEVRVLLNSAASAH